VDPNPDSMENSTRVEDSSVLANQAKVDEAQSEVATLSSRVQRLDELKREDLMRAAGLLKLNDPIIEQKLPAYQTAQAEKARMLNSGLGRNHPDVKAIQAQIDLLQQQLSQQIDSIRKGLTTELAIAHSSLQAMQNNLGSTQSKQQEKKTASVQYLDAKYRYIQERKLLEAAKTRLNSETMERTMPQQSAMIRDAAEPELFPSKPKVILNLLLGAAAGLALGIGLAFFLEYLDTSLKSMDDIENHLGLPVLGVIPKGTNLLTTVSLDSADAEAYRLLSTGLESRENDIVAGTISVVSGGASEGKSTTSCNLAVTFAAAGQKVLVVDADMRRSTLHQLFNVQRQPGLADYLLGKTGLEEAIKQTTIDNLWFLPSGSTPASVASLVKSARMSDLMKIVRERFDLVLFDCTPILGVSDGSMVAKLTDACLLVVQHRRFPRSMLVRVKQILEGFRIKILGVVLNNVDVRHDPQYQFYTSYREYYGKPQKQERPARALEKA
jgi:capsular exopolysaccharide synthesis family protein